MISYCRKCLRLFPPEQAGPDGSCPYDKGELCADVLAMYTPPRRARGGAPRASSSGPPANGSPSIDRRAAREMKEQGTFTFAEDAADGSTINSIFA